MNNNITIDTKRTVPSSSPNSSASSKELENKETMQERIEEAEEEQVQVTTPLVSEHDSTESDDEAPARNNEKASISFTPTESNSPEKENQSVKRNKRTT